jgi:hypothetical protein
MTVNTSERFCASLVCLKSSADANLGGRLAFEFARRLGKEASIFPVAPSRSHHVQTRNYIGRRRRGGFNRRTMNPGQFTPVSKRLKGIAARGSA